MRKLITNEMIGILDQYPYAADYFEAVGLGNMEFQKGCSLESQIDALDENLLEDIGMTPEELKQGFETFITRMEKLRKKKQAVKEITIFGGQDKSGNPEHIELTIRSGDVVCIVGPTGSGKSRLLADIECLAQKDTQTRRQILIDGREPSSEERFRIENKLIAQLSQNMNYVMDLPVMEFLKLHGESRMVKAPEEIARKIFDYANELAGEQFREETPLTQLSGGQSRALMIADAALLSTSPVVLIDEIENAGVDRKKALQLLVKEEKIVLMSTHDPILALMGDTRIVIENGGIKRVIRTTEKERSNLVALERVDRQMQDIRNQIRRGDMIEYSVEDYLKAQQ